MDEASRDTNDAINGGMYHTWFLSLITLYLTVPLVILLLVYMWAIWSK